MPLKPKCFLCFYDQPLVTGAKTKVVSVHPAEARLMPLRTFPGVNATLLGVIKWYGAWRCYAFYPEPQTIFEPHCLGFILQEVERLTTEHRVAAQTKRRAKP